MPLSRQYYHEQNLKMLDASLKRDQEKREEQQAAQRTQEFKAKFAAFEAKSRQWRRNNEAWFAAHPEAPRRRQRGW